MNYYIRYKTQIEKRKEEDGLTKEYIVETTERLDYYYLKKKKLTQEEYDELITLMSQNTKNEEKVL